MNKIEEMAEKYVEERRDLDVGRANAQFNCFNMIDTDKLGAVLDYYVNGWFGISITYEGKTIKKIEK